MNDSMVRTTMLTTGRLYPGFYTMEKYRDVAQAFRHGAHWHYSG